MSVKIVCPCGAMSVADCTGEYEGCEYEGCAGSPPSGSEFAPSGSERDRSGAWSAEILPPIDDAAFYGIAGNWARQVGGEVEAHENGILVATLVAAGNAIGPGPHIYMSGGRHGVNLSALLVGPSSSGRKGETINVSLLPIKQADPDWHKERVHSGLGSGEAVIRLLDDGTAESPRADARLLVREGEFAGILTVASREGSTLSSILRNSWDGVLLESVTKASTLRASDHHVSVLAAITEGELRTKLTATESGNGFANRFLFCATARDRLLPRGGRIDGRLAAEYGEAFAARFSAARKLGRLDWDDAGGALWDSAYDALTGDRRGLVGAVTGRAESQALRLSLLYAALDGSPTIGEDHVRAALSVWHYCELSARLIFGDTIGNPDADAILAALRSIGSGGLTRTQVRDLFSRHRTADALDAALKTLLDANLITVERRVTGGPPETIYRCAISAISAVSP